MFFSFRIFLRSVLEAWSFYTGGSGKGKWVDVMSTCGVVGRGGRGSSLFGDGAVRKADS